MAQKLRDNVDWWDQVSEPKHGQKHPTTKRYYNEYTGTWTSKKSKRRFQSKGTVVVYDFYYYHIDRIKEDFGNKAYEKVAMFLTKQFQRQMQGYRADDWDYVYWDSRRLELFLGYKWRDILNVLDSNYINIDHSASKYNRNKRCWYIQLSPKFVEDKDRIFKRSYLRDVKYQNSIKRYCRTLSKDLTGIKGFIADTLDHIVIEIKDINVINQRIWDQKLAYWHASLSNEYLPVRERKEIQKRLDEPQKIKERYLSRLRAYYANVLEIQQTEDRDQRWELYNIKESSFGSRLSHTYSNMPREYRKHLKIDGDAVIEVDIKASQPTFLFVLFSKWYRTKYRNAANTPQLYSDVFEALSQTNMDVYKYMVLKLKGLKYLKDPMSREEMKSLFYRLVFGHPKYKVSQRDKKEIVVKAFGSDFYDFLEGVSKVDLRLEGVDRTYKNLSAMLQREESAFLYSVMKRLIKEKVYILPLYDSLIVRKGDQQRVVSAFESIVVSSGLKGIIRLK